MATQPQHAKTMIRIHPNLADRAVLRWPLHGTRRETVLSRLHDGMPYVKIDGLKFAVELPADWQGEEVETELTFFD